MNRTLLTGLLLLVPAAAVRPGETLARRIAEKAESVRELQELYEARTERTERRALLERILADAEWLEQVGGMRSARADALLALARWELLKTDAPPSHGFLGDEAGDARPSLLVRPPGADELPEALARYKDRLLFILLHNEGPQPVFLGRPSLELPGLLGEPRTSEPGGVETWPADLKALAKWGTWPARLDGQQRATLLVWLAPTQTPALSLSVPVRWSVDDDPPRQVRAVFLRESFPEELARARRKAAQLETSTTRKLEDLAPRKAQPPAPVPDPPRPPKPADAPAEALPPEVGKVERAGSEQIIQVRLKDASVYQAEKELRVRRKDRWRGSVRLNESSDRDPNKRVFWATIVEGDREDLIGGTLHEYP